MGLLDGQVAVVTGSESGIGQSIAVAFGLAGAAVVVNEFANPEGARATVSTINAGGGTAVSVHADVSQEGDVERLFAQAEQLGTRASILVNDAGVNANGKDVVDTELDDWNRTIATNLTGAFLCSRRFLRAVREREEAGGKIICITSVHQEMPALGTAAYCATKGGLHMFVKCLALEAAQYGVNVNAIAPGTILTAMTKELIENPKERAEHEKTIPWGRSGVPEDIAQAALYLASANSDYVTGTTLVVDGGMLLNVASGPPQRG